MKFRKSKTAAISATNPEYQGNGNIDGNLRLGGAAVGDVATGGSGGSVCHRQPLFPPRTRQEGAWLARSHCETRLESARCASESAEAPLRAAGSSHAAGAGNCSKPT